MLHIRQARIEDSLTLAEMRWAFRQEGRGEGLTADRNAFNQRMEEFLRKGLESGEWVVWLAELDTNIVAHAFIHLINKVPKPNKFVDRWGYLTNVYTRPEVRNQGIGSQLMAQVNQWAFENDLEMLLVWPSEESRPFYQRVGYQSETEAVVLQLRDYVV